MARLSKRQIGIRRTKALRGTTAAILRYLSLLIVFTLPKKKDVETSVHSSITGADPLLLLPVIEPNALLEAVLPVFQNALKTGELRAAKLSGQLFAPEFIDYASIAELSNSQLGYIKNLQAAQQQKFTEILIEGQTKGLSLRDVTKNAVNEIDGLTKNRAQMIAKTEIVKAHSAGMLNTLKFNNVEEYQWSTRPLVIPDVSANLDRAMDKRVYKVGAPPPPFRLPVTTTDPSPYDPYAPLPVASTHPNCSCVIVVP